MRHSDGSVDLDEKDWAEIRQEALLLMMDGLKYGTTCIDGATGKRIDPKKVHADR